MRRTEADVLPQDRLLLPQGQLIVPGSKDGINTKATPTEAAAVADKNNTVAHLRQEFYIGDHRNRMHTTDLASGAKISLFKPSSPYTPESTMIIAAGPDLFAEQDTTQTFPTQTIYDLPPDAQQEYWSATFAGLDAYNNITSKEKNPADYTVFAGENCINTRTTIKQRTSRSIALPHIHLVRVKNSDIQAFGEKDNRMKHVLHEQAVWAKTMDSLTERVSNKLSDQSQDILDQKMVSREAMPFGYTFSFARDASIEQIAEFMRDHHEIYTKVAERMVIKLSDHRRKTIVQQPSYRLYLLKENEKRTAIVTPEVLSHGGVLEATGIDYARNPQIANPYSNEQLDLIHDGVFQAIFHQKGDR